jgi:vitamin B12/bleomycin/antimicrobial peptide transport system ATP-binding/permease protein
MWNRAVRGGLSFLGKVWKLARPYWSSSEERWQARGLLALVVVLTLGLVFILVLVNDWNRQFYEAIQNKDLASFGPLLLRFCVLAAIYITGAVYKLYFTQMLQIRWRTWMTRRFLGSWLDDKRYYRMELHDRRTDNPDQRISEDLRMFTSNTLDLSLGLLGSLVTLVSFVVILWTISGPLSFAVAGREVFIPGYMVWAAVLYALVGSLLTHFIGRPLIGLSFRQQRFEADFRFLLARLRENAEGVALYHGEESEGTGLRSRFERIRANFFDLMRFTKRLTFFTVGYDQVAIVFPILVAAPRYFSGEISLGVLFQISNAFSQVQGSLSWFVESYGSLAVWKATVDRLLTFQEALAEAGAPAGPAVGLERVLDGTPGVHAADVDLGLPNGRIVLADASFDIEPGDRVLFTGPTGAGKSTLFRAIAGIWPFGKGQIQVPANARLLFLPQRPYIPIASLRDAVSFPGPRGTFGDEAIREALRETGLEGFTDRLDEEQNWALSMSGGEQQRLALARALLQKPDWLFLDEATASLDEDAEQELYQLLQRRLPEAAIVSIAHRPQLASYHQRRYDLTPAGLSPAGLEAQPVAT